MFITYTTPIWWLVGVKNFLQLGNIFFIKRLKLYWFGWKIKHKIYIYYELSETETRSAGSLQSWRGWRGTRFQHCTALHPPVHCPFINVWQTRPGIDITCRGESKLAAGLSSFSCQLSCPWSAQDWTLAGTGSPRTSCERTCAWCRGEDSLYLGAGELESRPGEILPGVHQPHVLQNPVRTLHGSFRSVRLPRAGTLESGH